MILFTLYQRPKNREFEGITTAPNASPLTTLENNLTLYH
jgi:hypothetical protein